MADLFTAEKRSWVMSRVKDRDTKPERLVRSIIHRMGYRFRVRRRDLPGNPDIVLPKRRCVVFVHGCFWHLHNCKYGRVKPKTNADFWNKKRISNKKRDERNIKELKIKKWGTLTIWECQIKDDIDRVIKLLKIFLFS